MICRFCNKEVTAKDIDGGNVFMETDPNQQPPSKTLHHTNCGKKIPDIYWGDTPFKFFLATDEHGNKYLFPRKQGGVEGSYGIRLNYPGTKYRVVKKPHERIKHLAGKEVKIVHFFTGLCITDDLVGIGYLDLERNTPINNG